MAIVTYVVSPLEPISREGGLFKRESSILVCVCTSRGVKCGLVVVWF